MRTRMILVCAALLILVAAGGAGIIQSKSAAAASSTLSVVGNHLVDNGSTVILRGVNRSGAEYACTQNFGFFDGPSDDASIAAIAAWGTNVVRVPFNESCWLGINGAPAQYSGANYQAAIIGFVMRLRAHGLYVILDNQFGGPGTTEATTILPMPDADHAPALWTSVANAFKSDKGVIFDLYNEPHDVSWSCWANGCQVTGGTNWIAAYQAAGMNSLTAAIRATGATNVIMVGGLSWEYDISGWLANRPNDGQLIASIHNYGVSGWDTPAIWNNIYAPTAAQVPVTFGEMGFDSYVEKIMTWADAHGIGYLAWTWDTWGNNQALVSNYNGTPTTYGLNFKNYLAALPQPTPTPTPTPPPPAPTVGSVAPSNGPNAGGTSVTVTGTNFTGASAVKFGVATSSYVVNSATQITAMSPAGSGTLDVTVSTTTGTSVIGTPDQYTYTAPPPPAPFDHVFTILMENHGYSQIIGSASAPYINSLTAQGAVAGNYFGVGHPSLPNYAELTSGQSFTNASTDCDPSATCQSTAANIADSLEANGKTWREYAESMGAPCVKSTSGLYATRHNPFVYYTDITSSSARCNSHVVDYSNLAGDLAAISSTPNYAFLTPNTCSDMHDCSIATGDTWLSTHVPSILNSPAFTTQHSLLIIVWDEDNGTGANQVALIALGTGVKVGYTSPVLYNHYSLLRMTENALGLPTLTGNDAAASPLSDLFGTAPPPPYVVGAMGTNSGLWVLHSGSPTFTSDGGTLLGAPAVVAVPQTSGPAVPLYLATGSDHGLYVRNDTQQWHVFGGGKSYCIDNPAGVVIGGTLYIACEGMDHALYHAETSAPSGTNLPTLDPNSWQRLGGILVSGPAVANVAGVPTYLVIGTDQHVYSRDLVGSSFTRLSWVCIGHPALATFGSTSYFGCHGTDNGLWYATNSGSGWSGAQSLGGSIADGVGIAATSMGPIFFVEAAGGGIYHRSISTGWMVDGGQVTLGVGAAAL